MNVTPEDARFVARRFWGINAFATLLDSEWGGTFNLTTENGDALLLKFAPNFVDVARLELEVAVVEHLSSSNCEVQFPKIIKSEKGDAIVETEFGNARIYTWIKGRLWSDVNPHSKLLLKDLGRKLAAFKTALAGFDHPGAHHNFIWSPHQVGMIKEHIPLLEEPINHIAYRIIDRIENKGTFIELLPKTVNYNDSNDQNVIVDNDILNPSVVGFIDFGDLHYGPRINDIAICLAYAMMQFTDPLAAGSEVIAGYVENHELTEDELSVLFDLIKARLVISTTMAAVRESKDPNNTYWQISASDAQMLLLTLDRIPSSLALSTFRWAAGYEPSPKNASVIAFLENHRTNFYPVLGDEFAGASSIVFDWSVGSTELGTFEEMNDVDLSTFNVFNRLARANARIGIGRYNEPRAVYTTQDFHVPGFHTTEARTIHIGMDLFVPAGTPLYAPLDGTVCMIANNAKPKEYGPLLILQHEAEPGVSFYTLYGHNSLDSLDLFEPGDEINAGQLIGYVGDTPENGGWAPHLHFQVMTDTLEYVNDFPGVVAPSKRDIWLSICPDPNLILNMDGDGLEVETPTVEELVEKRKKLLGQNLSLSHKIPLNIVRGRETELIDSNGNAYLDTRNNIAHCGHEHPRIVEAGKRQMAVLNTNTRYLSAQRLELAEKLLSSLPSNLKRIYFVNSGSEANDLALRMARVHTCTDQTLVMDQGYHGHTGLCIDVSDYKFSGIGGGKAKFNIRVLPSASEGVEVSKRYLDKFEGPLTFIHESLPSCAGQIFPPDDYFKEVYKCVHKIGGICIADEVQTGLGRIGSHFWSFEKYGITPDIVTIGKPLGNGHPIAAVAVTDSVADAFDTGMEFFSSFGGNPVSCAIANEVLNVIYDEKLMERALLAGNYWLGQLNRLQEMHHCITDVRGSGLYIGIEFDSELACYGKPIAKYIDDRMIDHRILTSFDGPDGNVMKIKPPMCITSEEIDRFVLTLEKILAEDPVSKAT